MLVASCFSAEFLRQAATEHCTLTALREQPHRFIGQALLASHYSKARNCHCSPARPPSSAGAALPLLADRTSKIEGTRVKSPVTLIFWGSRRSCHARHHASWVLGSQLLRPPRRWRGGARAGRWWPRAARSRAAARTGWWRSAPSWAPGACARCSPRVRQASVRAVASSVQLCLNKFQRAQPGACACSPLCAARLI